MAKDNEDNQTVAKSTAVQIELALATLRTAERIIRKVVQHFEENEMLTKGQFGSICLQSLLHPEDK